MVIFFNILLSILIINTIVVFGQVVYKAVTEQQLLWETFKEATKELLNDISPTEIKKFFTEWVRKMVHARLAEFEKCYTITCKESKGEHVKGGQTLRDNLYKFEKKFSSTSRNPKKGSQKSSGNVINNKYSACDYENKSKNQEDT